MDYFKSTPLRKWNKDRIKEYFVKKGLHLTSAQLHSGATFSTARLNTLRRIYGNVLGEEIYLIIRERLEREEDTIYKKSLSASPAIGSSMPNTPLSLVPNYTPTTSNNNSQELLSMSDLDLGSPVIKASSPIDKIASFPPPQLNISSNVQHSLKENPQENPLKENPLKENPQEEPIKYLDFKETDERAKKHFGLINAERERQRQRAEDYINRTFIEEHPPLLWQPYHLQYLLKSLDLPTKLDISIDDFIFLTQEELEKLYPGRGEKLYLAIRSRFVDPNIKKIPIRKYLMDC